MFLDGIGPGRLDDRWSWRGLIVNAAARDHGDNSESRQPIKRHFKQWTKDNPTPIAWTGAPSW
jgi:hypothetical protein